MSWRSRKSPRAQASPTDELANLGESVRSRGQADIEGAARRVDAAIAKVAGSAGVAADADAERWLRDRLRLLLVMGLMDWFQILDRLPESGILRSEWDSLCRGAAQFGPEHLIAWWWLLSDDLFRPLIDNQLERMGPILADAARQLSLDRNRFRTELVDWMHLFAS